jgi:hypothetical protein
MKITAGTLALLQDKEKKRKEAVFTTIRTFQEAMHGLMRDMAFEESIDYTKDAVDRMSKEIGDYTPPEGSTR